MNFNTITYSIQSGVVSISLNRPDRYNAFNKEMNAELLTAIQMADEDSNCRVIVLTGKGKAFCSGQDLKDIPEKDMSFGAYVRERYNPLITAICEIPKPVVCKLNGVAAGAGCSVALACDYIIASDHVHLAEAFVNVGLVLDSGSTYFLPRLVGSKRAFELATMGSKVGAQQALEWGLINKVVPFDELDKATDEVALYYANAPTKAIGLMKKMLNKSTHSTLAEVLEMEAAAQEIAGSSADFKEGVSSFIEKRLPKFTGN